MEDLGLNLVYGWGMEPSEVGSEFSWGGGLRFMVVSGFFLL